MVGGHWVPEMVALAGGVDCFGKPGQPSFTVEWKQIVEAQPDIIVAMPCGFDVRRGLSEIKLLTEKAGWDELPAAKSDSIFVVRCQLLLQPLRAEACRWSGDDGGNSAPGTVQRAGPL